jgi:hypothetical protein
MKRFKKIRPFKIGTPIFFYITSTKTYNLYIPSLFLIVPRLLRAIAPTIIPIAGKDNGVRLHNFTKCKMKREEENVNL